MGASVRRSAETVTLPTPAALRPESNGAASTRQLPHEFFGSDSVGATECDKFCDINAPLAGLALSNKTLWLAQSGGSLNLRQTCFDPGLAQ